MAREARKKSSTGLYHILIRTGDRIFLDDSDREQFCQLLKEYFSVTAVLYGIRISDRKIHLIADEKKTDIASVIKPFCTSYARYYNRVHSVNGKLFEGRFKSEPIESDAMLSSVAAYLYRDCPQDFGKESFDCAISFQSLHHFTQEKKIGLYEKIHSALKEKGVYIECDYMVLTQQEEDLYFSENERKRKEQGISDDIFCHYDTPCTIENQIKLLKKAGFKTVKQVFRIENTTMLIAEK